MANNYTINERDLEFVLYEHLKVLDLCGFEKFSGFGKDDFEMIRKEALKFAKNELAPLHELTDREGLRFEDGKVYVPQAVHKAVKNFCEGGWIAVARNPEYGGGGLPTVMRMMTLEFFEGTCVSAAIYPGLSHGVGHLVESFGDETMKAVYTEKLYRGEWMGTMCLTEPQAGSALGEVKTTAKRIDGGLFKIQGTKQFISAAEQDISPNIIHMALARIEGAPAGVRGISLFLVPKVRVNEDGSLGEPNDVTCVAIEKKMGLHGSPTCQMAFGENDNCIGYLVGEENKGLIYMFQMMNEARISVGIQALAQAAAAYEAALAYAKERIQGQDLVDRDGPAVAIINHPDVKRMLLTMKSVSEGLRALLYISGMYYDFAQLYEQGELREKYSNLLEFFTPICKAYASDKGFMVCNMAMQVLGGYGYTRDYPLEQFLRDSWITCIYEGTNRIQSFDLLGRKAFMKDGAALKSLADEIAGFIEENKTNPQLGRAVDQLRRTLDMLLKVVKFVAPWRKGNPKSFQLAAYPFLESMGDLVVSWLLLQQAVIAWKTLQSGTDEKDFYNTKIQTARFFVGENLPLARARCQSILEGGTEPLDIPLTAW